MKEQNYKNHSRMVPMYHYFLTIILLAILIKTCLPCCSQTCNFSQSNILIGGLTLACIVIAYFARAFALKAQDRVIRAEENLRHFVATGKLLPGNLRMNQIIALRFASDDEWLDLIERAIKENLNSKDIKQSIKNWKADFNRV